MLSGFWIYLKQFWIPLSSRKRGRQWGFDDDDDDDFDFEMGPTRKKGRKVPGEVTRMSQKPLVASWVLPNKASFENVFHVRRNPDKVDHGHEIVVVDDDDDDEDSGPASQAGLPRLPIHAQGIVSENQSNEPDLIDLTEEACLSTSVVQDDIQEVKQKSKRSASLRCHRMKTHFTATRKHTMPFNSKIVEKFMKQSSVFSGWVTKETVRLEEKELYRNLLQDITKTNLYNSSTFGSPKFGNAFSPSVLKKPEACAAALETEKLHPSFGQQMRSRCNKRISVPFLDLTVSILDHQNLGKPPSELRRLSEFTRRQELVDRQVEEKEVAKNASSCEEVVVIESADEDNVKPAPRVRTLSLASFKEYKYPDVVWLKEFKDKQCHERSESERSIREQMVKVQDAMKQKDECLKLHAKLKEKLVMTDPIRGYHEVDVIHIPEEETAAVALTELTSQMQATISAALRPSPPNEVLVQGFNIPISRRDMRTLDGTIWLNDSVINFYMNLLMERGKLDNFPSVHAFSTFFYPKLKKDGYNNSLKRWTKKVDIFGNDFVVVPVHLGLHWCLAVVDFKKCEINYYDSMGGKNDECLVAIQDYLKAESQDKKKTGLDMTNWKLQNIKKIPQQQNGCDCGVFACQYAVYVTQNSKITFSQNDMPYFRKRMVYEILKKNLL